MSHARKLRRAKSRRGPRGPVHHVTASGGPVPTVLVDGIPVDRALVLKAISDPEGGRVELPNGVTLSFAPTPEVPK